MYIDMGVAGFILASIRGYIQNGIAGNWEFIYLRSLYYEEHISIKRIILSRNIVVAFIHSIYRFAMQLLVSFIEHNDNRTVNHVQMLTHLV